MKRIIAILILSLLITANAYCHPPSQIGVERLGTQITVTVIHGVLDNKTHYVKRTEITLNGKKTIEQNFTMQTDDDMQQVIYVIPSLQSGDKMTIKAVCNQSGELTREIVMQ
jgi:hypothetical protein